MYNVYMDGVMKQVKIGMGRRGGSFMEDGREWRLPAGSIKSLVNASDLQLQCASLS